MYIEHDAGHVCDWMTAVQRRPATPNCIDATCFCSNPPALSYPFLWHFRPIFILSLRRENL